MDHTDHVNLLRDGIPAPGGVWADFGSGAGAFTLALADLLGPGAEIHSVDQRAAALREQERAMRARFPQTTVHYRAADFTQRLSLPPLDGAVMANALHFVQRKDAVVQLVHGYLKPGGVFLLVEYDTDRGNPWVPYPLAYPTWEALARRSGFSATRRLATQPSRFLGAFFSAASVR